MTGGAGCPCGLRGRCPVSQPPDMALDCPVWRKHVRPTWWERITSVALYLTRRWWA